MNQRPTKIIIIHPSTTHTLRQSLVKLDLFKWQCNLLIHRPRSHRNGIREANKDTDRGDPERSPGIAEIAPDFAELKRSYGKLVLSSMDKSDSLRDGVRDVHTKNCSGDDGVKSLAAGHVQQSIDDAEPNRQQSRADGEAERG